MATTYDKIATTTLGSAGTTITFSSIASSWTDLRLVVVGTMSGAGSSTVDLTFNGDTAANYSMTRINGNGTTATSASYTARSQIWMASLDSTTSPTLGIVNIFSYAGSTNKTVLNGSGNVSRYVALWRSTAAITSITLTATTFAAGSIATLYGIAKA